MPRAFESKQPTRRSNDEPGHSYLFMSEEIRYDGWRGAVIQSFQSFNEYPKWKMYKCLSEALIETLWINCK